MTWGVIDDDTIAEARALIGTPLRRDRMQWVETATRDAIAQFCLGIADDNPLWLDPEYAATTRWGGLLAPPAFLYAVDATIVAPKLPGVQWIYAGAIWRWNDVIHVDQPFETTATLLSMDEKHGKRFGRWVLQTGEVTFSSPTGAVIATAQGRIARTPRQRGSSGGSEPSPSSSVEYTPARLAEIQRDAARHERLGSRQRLWESVAVGDTVGPLVRGPLELDDIYRWYTGAQGALHYGGAHGDAVRYRHRHDDYEINTKTGAKDAAARGHFTAAEGRTAGMGGAYDVGPHRISWLVSLLTDWAGDDGFVAGVSADVLRPNLVTETTWWSGIVRETWTTPNNSYVSIGVTATNQDDVVTARGSAVVALPSGRAGAVDLPVTDLDDRWLRGR